MHSVLEAQNRFLLLCAEYSIGLSRICADILAASQPQVTSVKRIWARGSLQGGGAGGGGSPYKALSIYFVHGTRCLLCTRDLINKGILLIRLQLSSYTLVIWSVLSLHLNTLFQVNDCSPANAANKNLLLLQCM